MKRAQMLCTAVALVWSSGCDVDVTPPPGPPPSPAIDEQLRQALTPYGVVPIGPMPAQNSAQAELGRLLMFDKILSGNRDISCATCHHPSTSGTDGQSLAIGTGGSGLGASRTLGPGRQFVPRNAPTLLNQGLRPFYLFWDGRLEGFGAGPFRIPDGVPLSGAATNILAIQATLPVLNRREMRGAAGDLDVFGNPNELAAIPDDAPSLVWQAVMTRLLAVPEYQARFAAAFPGPAPGGLTFGHAATAIAAFITQSWSKYDSPFDRYLSGDNTALSPEAKRGGLLFFGRAQCVTCHSGALLGGGDFANTGVPQFGPGTGSAAPLDLGRADVIIPFQGPSPGFYRFAFRTPPLRNVELTAPYMHNGAYPNLEAVVRHYSDAPTALRTYDLGQISPVLRDTYHGSAATITDMLSTLDFRLRSPLGLSDGDQADLVAFLKSLTDPAARDLMGLIPASVPSGLPLH
ncbi:MAG TPA: cytochrome c peroxidase [Gemmatimonadales bacterium]|nr:cytochrome c peroxidase [Gemmatimonadales bacterium]